MDPVEVFSLIVLIIISTASGQDKDYHPCPQPTKTSSPEFISPHPLPNIWRIEGYSAIILCCADGFSKIQWSFSKAGTGSWKKLSEWQDYPLFIIDKANRSLDTGLYKCEISGDTGTPISHETKLTIYKPLSECDRSVVPGNNDTNPALVGNRVTFETVYQAKSDNVIISWYYVKNNTYIEAARFHTSSEQHNGSTITGTKVFGSHRKNTYTSWLEIDNVSVEHEGLYQAKIQDHDCGDKFENYTLKVKTNNDDPLKYEELLTILSVPFGLTIIIALLVFLFIHDIAIIWKAHVSSRFSDVGPKGLYHFALFYPDQDENGMVREMVETCETELRRHGFGSFVLGRDMLGGSTEVTECCSAMDLCYTAIFFLTPSAYHDQRFRKCLQWATPFAYPKRCFIVCTPPPSLRSCLTSLGQEAEDWSPAIRAEMRRGCGRGRRQWYPEYASSGEGKWALGRHRFYQWLIAQLPGSVLKASRSQRPSVQRAISTDSTATLAEVIPDWNQSNGVV